MAKSFQKNTKIIQLLVADTLSAENNIMLPDLIALLPTKFQERALRYKNKRSSINYCFGRLMLIKAIEDLGFKKNKLDQIHFSGNDKPLIDGFFFNISHSENIVTLAYSRDCVMGIDIEKKRKVDLKNFKSFFRKDEWDTIQNDNNPLEKFYWFWIRKEAILKAEDGKMNQVKEIFITSSSSGYFKKPEKIWQLHDVGILKNYAAVIASTSTNIGLEINSFFIKN